MENINKLQQFDDNCSECIHSLANAHITEHPAITNLDNSPVISRNLSVALVKIKHIKDELAKNTSIINTMNLKQIDLIKEQAVFYNSMISIYEQQSVMHNQLIALEKSITIKSPNLPGPLED
jgi:hypothetical protein